MKRRFFAIISMFTLFIFSFEKIYSDEGVGIDLGWTTQCGGGYYTFYDRYLYSTSNTKHGNRSVYITSNFTGTQIGTIKTAYKKWNSSTNYCQLVNSNSSSSYQIKIDKKTLMGDTLGITTFFVNEFSGTLPGSNYSKAYIYLDLSTYSTNNEKLHKVTAHEVGHALGLSHVAGTSSVMTQAVNDFYSTMSPQTYDLNTLRHVYC